MKSSEENIETAEQRSNIYGFLSLIYKTEVTASLLNRIWGTDMLPSLIGMGASFGDDFLQRPEDELIEELAVEYARLFLGPGPHISPHESVHHERDDGDWGQLWGKDTVLVKKFIETAGLEYKPEFTGMPDHISVELEFMQAVTGREAKALEENDIDALISCLKIEKIFLDEHLIKWIPVFCEKVMSSAELPFYHEVAKMTVDFIGLESREIDGYLLNTQKK